MVPNMPARPIHVFDADVHLHELDADLAPYFDQPWRRVLEDAAKVTAAEGARTPRGERLLDVPGYSPLTVYDPILGEFPTEEPRRLTSAELLRADLDERGVDAALVFPGRLLRAATSNDWDYLSALGRAYNQCLAERWVDPARGLYAAILTCNQLPEEAAAGIERYADVPGFAAVYLPTAGNTPLWGDRSYEPIFAAVEAAGLPVVLQGALTVHPVFPYELHHLPTALAKQTLSQPFGAMANLVSLVCNGVLARHPALKIVFNDAGLAWLPTVAERLDHFYRYLRDEVPFLTARPSESIRRQVYLTTHPLGGLGDERFLTACLDAVGVDRVVFGSDAPHFDQTSLEQIQSLPLSTESKRRILGENAQALYRLESDNR
jgi:uncharacterized protein